MNLNELFQKDYGRTIETVIKADDTSHILQEVEEYVITNEISHKLADFFEQYNNYEGANGVWISGFFGSGKSHLLKILSYVLEDRTVDGNHLGELFAEKVTEDAKLKGDIKAGTRIPSRASCSTLTSKPKLPPRRTQMPYCRSSIRCCSNIRDFMDFSLTWQSSNGG